MGRASPGGHPGAVPVVADSALRKAWDAYFAAVSDDKRVFDFGEYQDTSRSQQLKASGLLHNRILIELFKDVEDSLRFRAVQLEKTLVEAIGRARDAGRELNSTKFQHKVSNMLGFQKKRRECTV